VFRFTAPKRPTLDWGTLYSFSITVNKAPASGSSSLHVATAGTPSDLWIVEPNGIDNDRTPTIRSGAAVDEAATMISCADKTGMLTRNEPTVTTVRPMPDFDAAHVLALAALASSDGEQDPVDAAIRRGRQQGNHRCADARPVYAGLPALVAPHFQLRISGMSSPYLRM
jgi:hypothetical protein